MTKRGRILLLVPIYLLLGGFLLQNPYLPVISAALFSLFIYSRYHFGHADKEIKVENEIPSGERYVDESFTLHQKVRSKHPLYFEIEFTDIEDFDVESERAFSGTVYPRVDLKHSIVPKSRGKKRLGSIEGHIYDSMKLYKQPFSYTGDEEITIHSSKEAIRRAHRYAKRVKSEYYVKDIDKFVTRTSELDTIRDYQPGDRLRDIHWKSMSKFQKLMTKTYEKRSPINIQLLLDSSPSMRRGLKDGTSKLDHSIFVALEMLKNFVLSGHDFGLTVFDHNRTVYHRAPDHKRETFHKIYKDLSTLPNKIVSEGYQKASYVLSKRERHDREHKFVNTVGKLLSNPSKDIAGIISATHMIKTDTGSSLVIIISDLETSTDSFIKAIEDLKRRDMVVWVIIPFSPWYLVDEIKEETLEDAYEDFIDLEGIIHELDRMNVSAFLLHPSTEGIKILLQEGSQA